MKRWLPLTAIAIFVAAGVAIPRPANVGDPDVIRIVSSLPRSGSARGQTDSIVDGIRLAFLESNNQITVGNKTYKLDYKDLDDATAMAGAWTADAEIANANLAVRDPDVMVYIGTYNSAAARISMPILNRARMLMVSPANTAESLTKPNTGDRSEPMCYRPTGDVNFVRVVPTNDLQGGLAAEWADDLKVRRIYILDDNETYGRGIADQFERRIRELGIEVLGHESIDNKSSEFLPLMTKIKGKNPDMIYFGGTTQSKAGQLVKDMLNAGMDKCKFMGPEGCYEQAMIQSAGAERLIGRFYVTFPGLTPDRLKTGSGKAFVEKHKKLLGREPRESYALYGYEAALAAQEAIRRAGVKDRRKVCAAGRNLSDFAGASNIKWSFDENGDTTLQLMTGNIVVMKRDEKGQEYGDFQAVKDLIPRKKTP